MISTIWVTLLLLIGAGWALPERDCYGAAVEIKYSISNSGDQDDSRITSGASIYGYPASFGSAIGPTPSKPFQLKLANPEHGCHKIEDSSLVNKKSKSGGGHQALLVQRGGNCSFLAKARNAQAAGYEAMILYDPKSKNCIFMGSDESEEKDVTLLASSITATAAKFLINTLNKTTSSPSSSSTLITLTQPEESIFDLSEVALWLIAVSAVTGGCIWAGKGGLHGIGASEHDTAAGAAGGRQGARRGSEGLGIEVISVRAAASFIFVASAALVAMFFLLSKWLALVITGLFSIIAWQASTVTAASVLYSICPLQWRSYKTQTPCTGTRAYVRVLDLAALSLASAITATWLILVFFSSHSSWILQDVLCFSLVMLVFKTLQLPNLKVSAILLLSAMLYDVWWVFLQPVVVGGPSVMVEVATGGGGESGFRMPIVFAVPRFNALGTNPSLAMLGLGDVVLPGLLVAMARRWDVAAAVKEEESHLAAVAAAGAASANTCSTTTLASVTVSKNGFYFIPMVGAYGSGLLITFAALAFGWGGDQGQPALLYLVPCTLGMLCLLGLVRGELSALWNWNEVECEGEGRGTDDVEQGEAAPLLSHPVTVT